MPMVATPRKRAQPADTGNTVDTAAPHPIDRITDTEDSEQ